MKKARNANLSAMVNGDKRMGGKGHGSIMGVVVVVVSLVVGQKSSI